MGETMSDLSWNTNDDQLRPRAYQLEMLEASMKENIIVAMDTGSGKTQIAILRISAELEVCPPGKIVWFLAPTVALCEQQYKAISLQLPNVRMKLLVGRDNVDRWSSQYIWDAALSEVRIVVSTHAVLDDALSHGFVTMPRLAMLVFDEAHHCTRNHPANRIMRDFYHRQDSHLGSVSKPKILGLTPSPTIRCKPKDLRLIEANLDSVTKTPCIHRDELMQYVHIPELLKIPYFEDHFDLQTWSPKLKSLISTIEDIDKILKNHHMLRLLSEDEIAKLPADDIKRRKWTSQGQDQLRKFADRARYIQEELGPWASDYFIKKSINQVTLSMCRQQNRRLSWLDEQTIYILNSLGQVGLSPPTFDTQLQMDKSFSQKCASVLNFLQEKASKTFRGIIFVEQRVTAYVLSHLLSVYPGTKSLFKCGTFVGISTNENKKTELRDLLDTHDQQNTLKDFREGRKNLIIATSALEEGIDISACNVVICFNRPPNLKSYIQRRGRARQEKSTIVLLSSLNCELDVAADWAKMESEMVAEYMRDGRDSVEADYITSHEYDIETRILRVDSTRSAKYTEIPCGADFYRAQITLSSALKHLHHFCRRLPTFPYVDNQPVFVFQKEEATGLFLAQVTLPNSVHPSLRRASALHGWPTEDMARKDAAFESYVALYKAGLLNDNLLPLLSGDMLVGIEGMVNLSSIVEVQQRYNPWYHTAKEWRTLDKCYWKRVNIRWANQEAVSMNLILPIDLPSLHWSPLSSLQGINYEFSMDISETNMDTEICDVHLLRNATRMILRTVPGCCTTDHSNDFVALFTPQRASQEIRRWIESYSEQILDTNGASMGVPLGFQLPDNEKLLRNNPSTRFWQSEHCAQSTATGSELPIINGLKSIQRSDENEEARVRRLKEGSIADTISDLIRDMECTTTTQLHDDAEKFARLAPFVMHHLEILLVGKELVNRLLPQVQFRNWGLLVEAISASSAKELSNNRRLAFIGDTVLDFLVTSQLFANHGIWPAGYLSAKKKLIISNSHLSRMALDVGLDKFILTDPFNPKSWKPPLISDIHKDDVESTRLVSKRILADAVEALIGAAYVDGQYVNSFECTRIFLPEIRAHSVRSSFSSTILEHDQGNSTHFAPTHFAPTHFAVLERLIGYKFRNHALLAEAMTHPSYEQDLAIRSYGRLAFLGNAVLSMVIVESLYHEKRLLSSNQMHLLRTATINNGFLAFTCLETYIEERYIDIQGSSLNGFKRVNCSRSIALWGFLRYGHPELAAERSNFLEKHAETCHRIRQGLVSDMVYPWRQLAQLEANSDLSDIIQALFGAVFCDSNGNMQQCALLAEKIKVLPILRQLMARKVDIMHPKTKLQELARDKDVTYHVDVGQSGKEYCCAVKLNGNGIAEVRDGACKEEVIIRAAELAIASLE